MNYWSVISLVLACVVVGASLSAKRRNYWIAVLSYTVVAAGSAFIAVFPWAFAINMAHAFNGGSGGYLAYVLPAVVAGCFAFPAVFLYPSFSEKAGFRVVNAVTGLVVVCSLGYFAYAVVRGAPGGQDPYFGKQMIFQWLLWMRVYLLRRATRPPDR